MNYQIYSHRYGLEIVENLRDEKEIFKELCQVLSNISDQDLINLFQLRKRNGNSDKSLSKVINQIIKERLEEKNWITESPIFKDKEVNRSVKDWRLDFVYPDIFSVEVAFNHSSATAVNLLKPVLASELNHVEKAFQTKFGIIVTATNQLKKSGGFDNAIGTFEGYCLQTKPLQNQLTIPLIIIGLEEPETFIIKHQKEGSRTVGYILMTSTGEILR